MEGCCRHSFHRKMGSPLPSSSFRRGLLIGLGVICCQLHCAAETTLVLQDAVYDNVAKSFDRQVIRIQPDLQIIIDRVVGRLHCGGTDLDHRKSSCPEIKCLQADSLFQEAGYRAGTEVLTPKTFAAVSIPLLFYALNPASACHKNSSCLSDPLGSRAECWTRALFGNWMGLSEVELLDFLTKLTRNYVSNGTFDHHSQAINASGIFEALGIHSEGNLFANKVPDMAAFLISKMFYGFPVVRAPFAETLSFDDAQAGNLTSHPIPDQIITSLFDLTTDAGSALSVERLRDIARKLNIGTKGGHAHPNIHIRRREKRHIGLVEQAATTLNKTCLSLEALQTGYELSEKKLLTQREFERKLGETGITLKQSFFDACEPGPVRLKEATGVISDAEKYGYGTVAVVIVSLISVVGILFIPLFRKSIYEYALQGFIALGVGTLSGDALLHLLPEALSIHAHGPADNAVENEPSTTGDLALWRSVACLGAIYAFYLWEICLHSFIHHRSKRGKVSPADHNHNKHSHVPDPSAFLTARSKSAESASVKDVELHHCDDKNHDVDKNHPPVPVEADVTFLGLAPLAWMILLGDSLHNFGDGLTIAAAFSIDVSSGISTTIAIFCHEVPHELGDFAILLSTGMSFRKAMALNFLTAVACLSGFYIGIPIAQDEDARHWIFTVAAGMFLYVALADMLPELKNGAKSILTVVVQNVGLLSGFAIMLLIALFEDYIII